MAKAPETKKQKFRRLAESRTNKAIEAISRIGNLSNTSAYEWTEDEVRMIVKALRTALAEVENRFSSPQGAARKQFKL